MQFAWGFGLSQVLPKRRVTGPWDLGSFQSCELPFKLSNLQQKSREHMTQLSDNCQDLQAWEWERHDSDLLLTNGWDLYFISPVHFKCTKQQQWCEVKCENLFATTMFACNCKEVGSKPSGRCWGFTLKCCQAFCSQYESVWKVVRNSRWEKSENKCVDAFLSCW